METNDLAICEQKDALTCGLCCLKMIADHYHITCSVEKLKTMCAISAKGVNIYDLNKTAEVIGLNSVAVRTPFANLLKDVPLPFIAYWNKMHFVVVYNVTNTEIYLVDPTIGKKIINHKQFCSSWINSDFNGNETGVAILFEPSINESLVQA